MTMRRTAGCLSTAILLAASAALAAEEKPPVVVMLGDSTTLCGRNTRAARIPDLVQAHLRRAGFPDAVVVNSGKGGDKAGTGFLRLQADVLAHRPDVVTVSFGLNDAVWSTSADFEGALQKIIKEIRGKSGATILLVTSTPFDNARYREAPRGDRPWQSSGGLDGYLDEEFCARMRKVAREHGVALCDLHACFKDRFSRDSALAGRWIMADGVHLTDEGNKAAAEQLGPMIAVLLRETKPARPKEAAVR